MTVRKMDIHVRFSDDLACDHLGRGVFRQSQDAGAPKNVVPSEIRPQNLSELRMVFARNLTILVDKERSVSEAARKLRISRSQLNRFLSGETYPRPDILQRLCEHFGTDARILTHRLIDLAKPQTNAAVTAILPGLVDDLEPVPTSVLPDGIYAEWMLSSVELGMVEMHLIRVYTDAGRRLGKVRVSISSADQGTKRYNYPMVICTAQYFSQRDGFASIDRVDSDSFHAFTSFRVGYGPSSNIFPGYKLSGISHHPKRHFSRMGCVMQLLPSDAKSLLAAARTPEFLRLSEAPVLIRRILKDIHEEVGPLPAT